MRHKSLQRGPNDVSVTSEHYAARGPLSSTLRFAAKRTPERPKTI
ncbi:Uncharacterised protein [Amycolatopsis camponoti]|uniref:Uncharacterized protein n=1 Tax=Amycolatopsis camponoti TaxID=2606593 RepID=A0A6I8MAT4_9PSEU|nr:Uncharacterised protein [Amycolatopsis camponoti]